MEDIDGEHVAWRAHREPAAQPFGNSEIIGAAFTSI